MRSASILLVLFSVSFGAVAQQQPAVPAPNVIVTVEDHAILHENTVKLVELMGARRKIEENLDKMVQNGKETMLQKFPDLNPAFVEEWSKRFRVQFNADNYVDLMVAVYEGHFTNDEILELIQIQRNTNEGKTHTVSPHLKEKLAGAMPSMMSEIIGGFTQLGSKLGAEIGQEIGTEHPEWVKDVKLGNEPAKK